MKRLFTTILVLSLSLPAMSLFAQDTDDPPMEPEPAEESVAPNTDTRVDEIEVLAPDDPDEFSEEELPVGPPPQEIASMPEGTVDMSVPSGVPDIYIIQRGDTLWDICQKLLDNPWYWPKLWSLNQYIENPHLIYPGNKLIFAAGSQTQLPRLDIVDQEDNVPEEVPGDIPVAPKKKQTILSKGKIEPTRNQIRLMPLGFITEGKFKALGFVSHSGDQKKHLYFGDRLYIEFYKRQKVSVGDAFQVVEKIKKVDNPDKLFGSIGVLRRKKAKIIVTAIHKKTVEAYVASNEGSVKRGDVFVAWESPIRRVIPFEPDKDMSGQILESEDEKYMIGSNEFVYVNLGAKQGVRDGMRLMVVRRGDGVYPGDDDHLPDVVVGRLIVVDTGKNVSTAYVSDQRDSLVIGDRVRTKLDN